MPWEWIGNRMEAQTLATGRCDKQESHQYSCPERDTVRRVPEHFTCEVANCDLRVCAQQYTFAIG
jgi:hypothetical protein